ncbi:MAG: glycosyltransferase family 4 protein [Alphaproteobacteria bacterium]|nr:glycosyltransferase family 4 protein [Alphaproteobacteria bacterium]
MVKNPIVLQVLPTLEMGGVERGTIEMAAALQKQGIKNYVVSAGGPMVRELEELGVEHITLPVQSKNPLVIWKNSRKLVQIIRGKGINLVHVRSRAPAWSVKWAAHKVGVPFIATFHGVYGIKPELLKKPYNRVMTTGKYVIAVSNFVKEHIMKNYGVPSEKIVVIHRGADIQEFNPDQVTEKQLEDFQGKYGISKDKPVITMVGRLTSWKGQGVLLAALKQMPGREIQCLIVGSDQGRVEYANKLKEMAEKLPDNIEVKFIKSCGEMPLLYAASTVVVNASLDPEAFGRVVVEAQAMGKIVVASGHGGAQETIQDGKTGFLFPVGDAKALADVLEKALSLPEEKQRQIGVDSIKSVQENFSTNSMCNKTIQLYREILK